MSLTGQLALSVFPALLASVGGYMAVKTHEGRTRGAETERAETTAVGDLAADSGVVSIRGTARVTGDPAPATMLDTSGAAVITRVEERSARSVGDRAGTDWDTIYAADDRTAFAVEDDTGSVPVDPPADGGFKLDPEVFEVEPGETPPAHVQQWLDETDDVDAAPDEHRAYKQAVVEDGEGVFATGEVLDGADGLTFGAEDHPDEFTVTDMSQAELAAEESYGLVGYVVGAFLLVVGLAPLAFIWLG